MSPRDPTPATNLRRLDPKLWRACAGNSVHIPTVHSMVYYFPQGHVEQSSSRPNFLSPLVLSKSLILCRITAVEFLADPITDEVFAKLLLQPIDPQLSSAFSGSSQFIEASRNQPDRNEGAGEEDKVVSFSKILTPSDANNGGGFSVPRFCADSIFPPLNYQAEPPVQTLSVTDVHGVVWDFRHIYRGTPRRHLLTTGWSKFVNHKKLVAGDSVVFMRNPGGQMFVGVRRAVRSSNGDSSGRYSLPTGGTTRVTPEEDNACGREGRFSRSGRGRLLAEAVAEAAELAAKGMPFEVVYYPSAAWSEFVVKAEAVEGALSVFWTTGMRVKMAMETEDSSRMTWFQGTVSGASVPDSGPWRGSPWRMLQVTWDEPGVLPNAKGVSPWQVEYISPTSPLHTAFPPAKKFRAPQNSGLLTNGEGDLFPITGFTNSLLNYNTFPAGMQGARQNLFRESGLSNLGENNIYTDNSYGNNMVPKLKTVSTELNIGSSQSEKLSPDSQSSVLSFGTELIGTQCCSSTKVGAGCFQLFGKIIHMKQPVESGFDDSGCTEDDGIKGLDVQCKRASAVGACTL
ncbi:auxin response factor 17-like isoform X2 [Juglans microcarpa x Juglans regia]|uniref:auxin response factor 17-like isoform X2 n=1 Tax=Juglans microcarpa x Juglans regia TaxID=2249226 RepID=UPI001B7E5D02|nr:auxin response factor 17-like isoform X2 [Juglans microcarpa x Juglans regia]